MAGASPVVDDHQRNFKFLNVESELLNSLTALDSVIPQVDDYSGQFLQTAQMIPISQANSNRTSTYSYNERYYPYFKEESAKLPPTPSAVIRDKANFLCSYTDTLTDHSHIAHGASITSYPQVKPESQYYDPDSERVHSLESFNGEDNQNERTAGNQCFSSTQMQQYQSNSHGVPTVLAPDASTLTTSAEYLNVPPRLVLSETTNCNQIFSSKPKASSRSKNIDGWKSNDAQKPKTYHCPACDKWFTSSGHLKRHYNTNLHKKTVESGKPDPATLPINVHYYPDREQSNFITNEAKAAEHEKPDMLRLASQFVPQHPNLFPGPSEVPGDLHQFSNKLRFTDQLQMPVSSTTNDFTQATIHFQPTPIISPVYTNFQSHHVSNNTQVTTHNYAGTLKMESEAQMRTADVASLPSFGCIRNVAEENFRPSRQKFEQPAEEVLVSSSTDHDPEPEIWKLRPILKPKPVILL